MARSTATTSTPTSSSSSYTRIPRPWLEQQEHLHQHHRTVAAKSRELNAPVWDDDEQAKKFYQEKHPLRVLWKKIVGGFCPPTKAQDQQKETHPSSSLHYPPSPVVIYAVPPPYGPYHSSPTPPPYGPPSWPSASHHQVHPFPPHYADPQQQSRYHHHHQQQPHHYHRHHQHAAPPPPMVSRSDRMCSVGSQWTDASGGSFVRVPLHRSIPSPRKSSLRRNTSRGGGQRSRSSGSITSSSRPSSSLSSGSGSKSSSSMMMKLRRSVSEHVIGGKPPLYSYRPRNATRSATVGSTGSNHSRHNAAVEFDWNELYLPPDVEESTMESIGTISTKETKNNKTKASWMMEWVSQGPGGGPAGSQTTTSASIGVTWADQQPPSPASLPPPPPPLQITTTMKKQQQSPNKSQTSISPSSTLVYSTASTTTSPSSWSSSTLSPSSSLSSLSPISTHSNDSNGQKKINNSNNWYDQSSSTSPSSSENRRRRSRRSRRRSMSEALTYLPKNRNLEQKCFTGDIPLVSGWLSYALLDNGSSSQTKTTTSFQMGYFVALPTCHTLYLYPSNDNETNNSDQDNLSDDRDDQSTTTTVTTTTTSATSASSRKAGKSTTSSSKNWITISMTPEKKAYVEMKMISPSLGKGVLVKTMTSGDTLITLLPVGLDRKDNNNNKNSTQPPTKLTYKSNVAPVAQHDAALHLLFALDGWLRMAPGGDGQKESF